MPGRWWRSRKVWGRRSSCRKVLLASGNLVLLYLKKLHVESTSGRVRVAGRVAVGLLMLGLWLGLISLSVSERFHHALHADAAHADHDCLIVGFAKSLVLHAPVQVLVAAPVLPAISFSGSEITLLLQRIDLRLVPGRAPPARFVLP